jgi:hypothetical protein
MANNKNMTLNDDSQLIYCETCDIAFHLGCGEIVSNAKKKERENARQSNAAT